MRQKFILAAVVVVCLVTSTHVFGQGGASTLGTLTGIVTDSSKARLPGVTVKVVNDDTGVANSMLTNEDGAFSFLLSPGRNYRVTAEFTGFQKSEITAIKVSAADTARLDIVLEVGDITITKRVEASRNPLFQGTTQDVGNLLDEVQIQGLPLVGNDPLALITTLPGYRANPLGHEFDTLGGLPMTMVNTVRDGLSVTDELYPGGVGSNTILNPDMISEIRLILAPVDAEAGRGNGQIQITTKSGTNKFQWTINYNLRQNALNALGPSTTRVKQPFGATFQYIVSLGGPIIKNRTFYFVNWDQQLRFQRSGGGAGQNGSGGYLAVPALTDLARNGVFRWFDGWSTQPSGLITTPAFGGAANGAAGVWSVDGDDPTITPPYWPNATTTAYTGALKCISVFGTIKFDGTPFDPGADCGTYRPRNPDGSIAGPIPGVGVVPGGRDYATRLAAGENPVYSWESVVMLPDGTTTQLQRPPDRTGYMQRLISYMPRVNTYKSSSSAGGQVTGGLGTAFADGLNRAAHEWVRGFEGLDTRNTFRGGTFGSGISLDQAMVGHKIINLKIDHVIDSRSRISVSTSFQDDKNSRLNNQSRWPDGIDGYSIRVPRVLTINGISTLSPNMVNEARFGINTNRSTQLPPWENPNSADSAFARAFLQTGWDDPNCNGTTGRTPSELCQTYGGASPVYYTPGAPGVLGYMNFTDNILPSGVGLDAFGNVQAGGINQGFGNSSTSQNQCRGTGTSAGGFTAYNCETLGKLLNFADTFSWNRGSHSIRAGAELRLTRTKEDSSHVLPSATGGASTNSASPLAPTVANGVATASNLIGDLCGFNFVPNGTGGCSATGLPAASAPNGGFNARLETTASDMLYLLSGSVASVTQSFWANGFENFRDGTWETWSTGDGRKTRHSFQNEYALFIKDDWKIGKNLTLNLGLRYEDYGNLYTIGFNTGILDEGFGLFGPTRMRGPYSFKYWLEPGGMYFTGYGQNPPGIDVRGTFLPNGQPNYIPGLCDPVTPGCGTGLAITATNNSSPGGPGVQVVGPTTATNQILTSVVNCVYGVQQTPLLPVSNCDPSLLTTQVFVGPGSDHPELSPTYRDRNNFGPAIGFSWRAPFIGDRKLLVRGGFQFTFGSAGRDKTLGSGSLAQLTQISGGATNGGALDTNTTTCTSPSTCQYDPNAPSYAMTRASAYALTLYDLPYLIPPQTLTTPPSIGGQVQSTILCPGGCAQSVAKDRSVFIQRFGVNRAKAVTALAPGYQDARTENFTLSVSTNLSRNSTLAVSYVATLGKNRPTGVNINMPNVYYNPELLDALNRTRAGEDVALFDQMFAGLQFASSTTAFGVTTAATNAVAAGQGYGLVGTCVTPTGTAANIAAILANKNAAIAAGKPTDPYCGSGQIYQSGSAHLRHADNGLYPGLAQNLANGNFAGVAAVLANMQATSTAGGQTVNGNAAWFNQTYGGVVRNGCNRLAQASVTPALQFINGGAATGNPGPVRCFPEDWIITNPSLDSGDDTAGGSTGLGSVLKTNWGYTNYQQLQFQYTLRLPAGVNIQATYLTSRTLSLPRDFYKTNTVNSSAGGNGSGGTALGQAQSGFSSPRSEESRHQDYGLSSDSLKHAIRLNGIFQLPIGPGKALLKNPSGLLPGIAAKLLGGWQMGIIYNGQSGQPFSIVAGDMLYGISSGISSQNCNAYSGTGATEFATTNCQSGLSFPDVVSPLWTTVNGKVEKNGPNGASTYFGYPSPFTTILDPQCSNPASGGAVGRSAMSDPGTATFAACGLRALVMKVNPGTAGSFLTSEVDNGQTPVLLMLKNPMPGNQGTLGAQTMRQPGRFYLDANLAKTFMFSETRGIQFRIDATNVMNHPTPPDMYFSLGPTTNPATAFSDQGNAANSALASGCVQGNVFCGRQVQFGIRMIN